MSDQSHDRTRDRDVIEAAHLLDSLAREWGVSGLIAKVIAQEREMVLERSQTNALLRSDLAGSARLENQFAARPHAGAERNISRPVQPWELEAQADPQRVMSIWRRVFG